jgi:hypothetical protein
MVYVAGPGVGTASRISAASTATVARQAGQVVSIFFMGDSLRGTTLVFLTEDRGAQRPDADHP